MERRASSFDVAKVAGVSQATVSYVLNNRTDLTIRPETRQRVLDAIRTTGYQPNQTARALASGKPKVVALWVPIISRSVSGQIIEQIIRHAANSDFQVTVVETANKNPEDMMAAGLLDSGTIAGIVADDVSGLIEQIINQYKNLPQIVTMGPFHSHLTDYVGIDMRGGFESAMKHLIEVGCKKIAFIGQEFHVYPTDSRYDAYINGIQTIGAPSDVIVLKKERRKEAYDAVLERFQKDDLPDGLLCFNDDVAIGASRALHELGINVPRDVKIIGSDGIDEAIYAFPSISTVAQPIEQMCETAWQYLSRRMDEPTAPISGAVLSMELILRESTVA